MNEKEQEKVQLHKDSSARGAVGIGQQPPAFEQEMQIKALRQRWIFHRDTAGCGAWEWVQHPFLWGWINAAQQDRARNGQRKGCGNAGQDKRAQKRSEAGKVSCTSHSISCLIRKPDLMKGARNCRV